VDSDGRRLQPSETHHRQGGAAAGGVGVAEGFGHFVVVIVALDERDGLAGRFDGGGEVTGLTLEFGRLEGAVRDDDRGGQFADVTVDSSRQPFHR
jgi:hypothetical protein